MAEVTEQLTRMERLLERTHDLVQEVAREQARLGGVVDQMDKRLASLETRLSAVDTRLEARVSALDTRLTGMDTRLDGLRAALDGKASTALVIGLITLLGAWSALLTLLPRWLPGP